ADEFHAGGRPWAFRTGLLATATSLVGGSSRFYRLSRRLGPESAELEKYYFIATNANAPTTPRRARKKSPPRPPVGGTTFGVAAAREAPADGAAAAFARSRAAPAAASAMLAAGAAASALALAPTPFFLPPCGAGAARWGAAPKRPEASSEGIGAG